MAASVSASASSALAASRVIVWFRKGLRLHDNACLAKLPRGSESFLLPVFVLDPHFVRSERVGATRWQFLLSTLHDLDQGLRTLGSRLLVAHSSPVPALQALWRQTGATEIRWEYDFEPYARVRDAEVRAAAEADGLTVRVVNGHHLYDLERLQDEAPGGKIPRTYEAFCKLCERLGPPARPLAKPTALPALPARLETELWQTELGFEVTSPPTFTDLFPGAGAPPASSPFAGGESEGLRRMRAFLADANGVRCFSKPQTNPFALEPPSTTGLSAYLKFGALSARTFYWALAELDGPGATRPPVSLTGQLLWREFFSAVAASVGPAFERIADNPVCRAIDWDTNEASAAAWAAGRTGYPLIDAAMRQLHEWGWMHHLARHIVACFLTRGDLWQSWTVGRDVFDRLLIDADWALNNANWMWLSCSAFFTQYWRVYSPVSFGDKYPNVHGYVRKFVPELARLPDGLLLAPWRASRDQLARAGVSLGTTYPHRIVDHDGSCAAVQCCADHPELH